MTIVFTTVAPDMITMTVDSAVTRIVNNETVEYGTTAKLYRFDGVGCVARWGSLDHNNIRQYLHDLNIRPETFDVDKLAQAVSDFMDLNVQEILLKRYEYIRQSDILTQVSFYITDVMT